MCSRSSFHSLGEAGNRESWAPSELQPGSGNPQQQQPSWAERWVGWVRRGAGAQAGGLDETIQANGGPANPHVKCYPVIKPAGC